MPQISIITVNYNNKVGLERTIKSVAQQIYKNYEHIIIDAASTDGSLEVIKAHQEQFSYWISEKDKGIYHGMNKGITQAKGKYLLFLNSGDYLIDEHSLSIDFEHLNHEILFGYHTVSSSEGLKTITYEDRPIDLGFFVTSTLPHSSTFIKKSLFDNLGSYDESYKICADWVFFFKAIIYHKTSFYRLEQPIGVFELGGISTNKNNTELVKKERLKFLNTIMNEHSITYIQSIYPKLKENFFLKEELMQTKKSALDFHNRISQLKGIGLLFKINKLIGS